MLKHGKTHFKTIQQTAQIPQNAATHKKNGSSTHKKHSKNTLKTPQTHTHTHTQNTLNTQ